MHHRKQKKDCEYKLHFKGLKVWSKSLAANWIRPKSFSVDIYSSKMTQHDQDPPIGNGLNLLIKLLYTSNVITKYKLFPSWCCMFIVFIWLKCRINTIYLKRNVINFWLYFTIHIFRNISYEFFVRYNHIILCITITNNIPKHNHCSSRLQRETYSIQKIETTFDFKTITNYILI